MDERKTFSVGSFCEPSIALFAFTVTFCIERTFCTHVCCLFTCSLVFVSGQFANVALFYVKIDAHF